MSLLQRKRERDQKAAEEAARLAEEKRLQELSIHPFIKSGCSRDVRDAYFQGLVFAAVADDDKIDKDERAMLADVGSSLGIQVEEIDEAIASVSALSDDNKLALVEECVNAIKGDENGVKLFCAQFVQVWMSHDHAEDELAEYLRQFAEWGGVDLPEATLNCLRKAIGENEETEEALYELSEWMGEESLKYFAVKRYGDVSQMLARIRKQKSLIISPVGVTNAIILPGGARMEMIYVAPGAFSMGSPDYEDGRLDDETKHRVTLTKGFWLGKYEVTQRQWESVMGDNPSEFKGDYRPVEHVSWNDCQEFIRRVSGAAKEQLGGEARLPTEAEWEYACRAGTTTAYSWGDALNGDRANCNGGHPCGTTVKGRYRGETVDVGSYSPNNWGFYDMHGNVYEWCQDWYRDYNVGDVIDPQVPVPDSWEWHILRGGCWDSYAAECRSAYRRWTYPDNRGEVLGFRLCCSAGV